MEKLNKIYSKDINREIQGVIKVDDDSFLKQELEEYVVTDEILKHMSSFFDAYNAGINGNTEKMGVWISGFFGSGKSHFLKIISYLLENKIVDGKPAVEYFNDKIQDKMLLADIKRTGSIPTDVILFNIDSKATIDSVQGKDNILSVFEKVFNEKMGLSTIPYVAELERFLIKQGKYEEFQEKFKNECGEEWKTARNDFYFRRDEVVNAYSKTLNKSIEEAGNWFDKAEENYDISVEKFAVRVKEYIETKGNNHHLVFLVDEVGQYIGDDRSLMLNLQTIVEDLGIYCGGKVWVLVTSQQAIDDVIKVIGNDFSKIQGRFDTKLSLSSAHIDEVIRKRILQKTPEAIDTLKLLYENNESKIKNLLTFSNAAYQKIYENSTSFAENYPFIPYQFTLLQDVFTDIRTHGYAGKHLSSGERSLIGAFQETAKKYENEEIDVIVPFYAFFDTIEQFLEHDIMGVIQKANAAEKAGELKEIDIRILKILFMLKNVKGLPTNIDNLATLYVSNINDVKISIKKEIQEALLRLEGQTLIQRNNDEYKFLTNEEQMINREIKQIPVDQNMISEYLKNIIYGKILTDSKFNYKNRIFSVTKYIDNLKCTLEYEIGIKIITTFSNKEDKELRMQSYRENNFVFVELEMDTLLYDEIRNILRIVEFIRLKSTTQQSEQVESIISAKKREKDKQEKIVTERVNELLNESEILIDGDTKNITSKDIKTKVNQALVILINNIFKKFSYIQHNFNTADIKNLFHEDISNSLLKKDDEFVNQKAYDAMREYLEEKTAFSGVAITIRSLLQDFQSAPYGWLDDDILYLLTKLLKDEEISLIYNNENQFINAEETLTKILKREYYDKTIIVMRTKVDINLINNLKYVSQNAFDNINLREDEDGMVADFKYYCLKNQIDKLDKVSNIIITDANSHREYQYPGYGAVERAITLYKELSNIRDTASFFSEISDRKDEIIEFTKKVQKTIDFFEGSQKKQFDDARKMLEIYDKNKDYADKDEELENVATTLKEILKANEPYDRIQELPMLREDLLDLLTRMYETKSAPIIEMTNNTIEYIKNELSNSKDLIGENFGKNYIETCENAKYSLENSNELINILAQESRVRQIKNKFMNALEIEKEKELKQINGEIPEVQVEVKPIIKRKKVQTSLLLGHSYSIDTPEDVDKYINELKEKLLKELEQNKNLTIE